MIHCSNFYGAGVNISEVSQWRSFIDSDGTEWDLSFLDAHEATYIHSAEGRDDISYKFYVSYSLHCFAKDYPEQTEDEKTRLMYHGPRESRPFCFRRYNLAKAHLRSCILNLGTMKVVHAKRGSYAVFDVIDESGNKVNYFAPFIVFREDKKFRIHVTSAYPVTTKIGGDKVKFLTIAHNLKLGKKLPRPKK